MTKLCDLGESDNDHVTSVSLFGCFEERLYGLTNGPVFFSCAGVLDHKGLTPGRRHSHRRGAGVGRDQVQAGPHHEGAHRACGRLRTCSRPRFPSWSCVSPLRALKGALAWNSGLLASGSRDRSIYLRDARSSENFVSKLVGHKQEVCGLKWSGDESQLASGGNDNKLLVSQRWSERVTVWSTRRKPTHPCPDLELPVFFAHPQVWGAHGRRQSNLVVPASKRCVHLNLPAP